MSLQTTPERRILIVELMDGRRRRYQPPKRGMWQSLKAQIDMAQRIRAKPLYAVCIHPAPGYDWVLDTHLARS